MSLPPHRKSQADDFWRWMLDHRLRQMIEASIRRYLAGTITPGGQVTSGAVPTGTLDHNSLLNLTTGDVHTQYQKESEKAQASGYASLDAGTKVPTAQLGTGAASGTTFLRGDQSWATPVDTDQLAKVSGNDTTAGYLNGKLVAGANVVLTEQNDGGNETLEIAAGAGASVTVQEVDGVPSITAGTIEFPNGTVTNPSAGVARYTPAAATGGHTIEDETTPLTQRTKLSFQGAGVVATDDAGNDRTIVTIPGGSGDTAPATIYVDGVSGNDTTGDGTSGAPYATVAKALSVLPTLIETDHTIDVADATYAEAIDLRRFVCEGTARIIISGNTTTPANVSFTGTVSVTSRNVSLSTTVALDGRVRGEIEGIRVNATADAGVLVQFGAELTIDRCTVTGTLTRGVECRDAGYIEFQGNCTVSGWSARGLGGFFGARFGYTSAGTLTVTGPGSSGNGIHLAYHAQFILPSGASGLNITVTGVQYAWQLGKNSLFQHIVATATLTATNSSTPGSSAVVQATDLSSWSTTQAVVATNFTRKYDLNSISYAEATGTNTWTGVGAGQATQNSVASGFA